MAILDQLSLKKKTTSPLILMAFGLLMAGAILITNSWHRLNQAKGLTYSNEALSFISNVIHETQKERAVSSLYLTGKATLDEVGQQRKKVDENLKAVAAYTQEEKFAELLKIKEQALGRLNEIRSGVDKQGVATEMAKGFGQVIDIWMNLQIGYARLYQMDGLESNLLSIVIFEKSKENMGRLRALLNVSLGADKPIPPQTVSLLSNFKAGIMSNLDSPGLSITADSRKAVNSLLASEDWKSVQNTFDTVIEHSATGSYGVDAKNFSTTITRVINGVKDVITPEIDRTRQTLQAAQTSASIHFWVSLSSLLVLLMASFSLAFVVIRSMTESLSNISDQLSNGADLVSRIVTQIDSASQNLSASTLQQAAALQQTATAVEETSMMVKRNAENAVASTEISEQSRHTATEGQKTVEAMKTTIKEISQCTEAIAKQIQENDREMSIILQIISEVGTKTKIINDIVFQTRLLSFNASVEAARAGEAGKGFAVVAEEVGNLAKSSGAAAKEISQLLEKSIQQVSGIVATTKTRIESLVGSAKNKVEAGTSGAEECGNVLGQIVLHASDVGSRLNQISIGSTEQSRGIDEISNAVRELDKVAQINSTSAQQSTTSALELSDQVTELNNMIHRLHMVVHGHAESNKQGLHNLTPLSVVKRPQKVSPQKKIAS